MIVCNINQIRRSLFRGLNVSNESQMDLLYKQFYVGLDRNLTQDEQEFINQTATSEVSKPIHSARGIRNISKAIFRKGFKNHKKCTLVQYFMHTPVL